MSVTFITSKTAMKICAAAGLLLGAGCTPPAVTKLPPQTVVITGNFAPLIISQNKNNPLSSSLMPAGFDFPKDAKRIEDISHEFSSSDGGIIIDYSEGRIQMYSIYNCRENTNRGFSFKFDDYDLKGRTRFHFEVKGYNSEDLRQGTFIIKFIGSDDSPTFEVQPSFVSKTWRAFYVDLPYGMTGIAEIQFHINQTRDTACNIDIRNLWFEPR